MSDMICIQDDFGNSIPLLDAYGNLSVQVLMLYTEDKLTEADRRTVNDFAATDEMATDALEGFAVTTNPSKTRYHLGQLNSEIQKRTGASALAAMPRQKSDFDYRKMAAAIAVLTIIVSVTYFGAQYFAKEDLSNNVQVETVTHQPSQQDELRSMEAEPIVEDVQLDDAEATEAEVSSSAEEEITVEKPSAELPKQPETLAQGTAESKDKQPTKTKDKKKDITANSTTTKTIETEQDADNGAGETDLKTSLKAIQLAESAALYETEDAAISENNNQEELKKKVRSANDRADQVLAAIEQQEQARNAKQEGSARGEASEKKASSDMSSAAKYPGGDIAMYKFIERKKVYTEAMQAQKLKGTVTVTFEIAEDGRVTDAKVKTGANGLMNEDALRVVRSMPSWKPAKDATGETIRSSKTIVVKYGE